MIPPEVDALRMMVLIPVFALFALAFLQLVQIHVSTQHW